MNSEFSKILWEANERWKRQPHNTNTNYAIVVHHIYQETRGEFSKNNHPLDELQEQAKEIAHEFLTKAYAARFLIGDFHLNRTLFNGNILHAQMVDETTEEYAAQMEEAVQHAMYAREENQLAKRYFRASKNISGLLQERAEKQVAGMFKTVYYMQEFGSHGEAIMRLDEKLQWPNLHWRKKLSLEEEREKLLGKITSPEGQEAYRLLIE